METYNEREMKEAGFDIQFVQDNQSMSVKGVLQRTAFSNQLSAVQTWSVPCAGSVFERGGGSAGRFQQPTGKWYGVELSEENKKQFLIPEGFAAWLPGPV